MEIKTKDIMSKYIEVSVEHEGTKIDLGLLDNQERIKLAHHLREIADELCAGIDIKEEETQA